MIEALFNLLFNYSVCNVNERRGGIDWFNLCRINTGDNYSPDIKNNNTITTLWATHNVNSNVGERNLPVEQANQKNIVIEMGGGCG